ncbi:hypothetical protein [Flavobacterium sp.]|uniref:hypothetical protein n=1 Tax=Flavobacterium sp. TaxID=239 RepID=UPI002B8A1C3B|nr:hypothetical protein [Flavobacterium sp.]HQA73380.1 hypothetical protein [Flavobacterium sp.]
MKKIILTMAAVFAISFANAQIKTEAGTFTKPTTGTYVIEASMTPNVVGGGIFSLPTLNSNLGLVGIKVRKFSSDTKALRMGANLTVVNSGEDDVDTEFSVGASIGIEHHMAGAERLSTYWGYEGNVGYVSSNGTPEDDGFGGITPGVKVAKIGLGASVFTGFDYYIMPKIYLGAEVSYGLAVTNTTPDGGDGVTRIELSPSITPSFRLGWQF